MDVHTASRPPFSDGEGKVGGIMLITVLKNEIIDEMINDGVEVVLYDK